MNNKRSMIGIFLICVIMVSFGLAYDPGLDQRYLPFLIVMSFVTLLFFFVKISQSNLKRRKKSILLFAASLAETLWLNLVGITLDEWFGLLFIGAICLAWFLVNFLCTYFRQRRVVSRWNEAYSVWKSGGSEEDYLREMEQCEAEIENDTGITLVYGGIPLKDYILIHKIYLLKEMGRNEECLALLKSIRPKIQNPEVQKALLEVEAEIANRVADVCKTCDDSCSLDFQYKGSYIDTIRKWELVIYIVIPLISVFISRVFRLAQGEKLEEILSGIMVGILLDLFLAIIFLFIKKHRR